MARSTHDSDDRSVRRSRQELGAWYTPGDLVDLVVEGAGLRPYLAEVARRRGVVRVLDPACGDGRFLSVMGQAAHALGVECELSGADVDPVAVAETRRSVPGSTVLHVDALTHDWTGRRFDLVIGNPPFLSQMSSATTRGGASARSGGPYADAAVEFMVLASELVEPDGGRVVFVLPQSILAARDARAMRTMFDRRSTMFWSWWTGEKVFDAQVLTCALGFEFGRNAGESDSHSHGNWSHVVTSRQAVPELPALHTDGTLADRAMLNANFRDEYYGMVGAVGDHSSGPPLITSGLIDPGRTMWGHQSITFAKKRFEAPRLDVEGLDPRMRRWAARRLVPKVLVANQTRIIEAVCDADGAWLPAVPVIGVYPGRRFGAASERTAFHQPTLDFAAPDDALLDDAPLDDAPAHGVGDTASAAWEIAAVLTSPVASAWAWHRSAGTGLSAEAIRLGPVLLGGLPWPTGDLAPAVHSLRAGDVRSCGKAVVEAYGIHDAERAAELFGWWDASLQRIERRAAHPYPSIPPSGTT